jgi:hypothetical protein
VAERYLSRRHSPAGAADNSLHPELEDYPDSRPGLVALVSCAGDGAPLDVQRTFLRHDGAGKAAVEFPTSTLGWRHRNGAIRLGEPDDVLLLGTTVEGCLLAMQETGIAAWVTLTKYAAPGFAPPNGLPPGPRRDPARRRRGGGVRLSQSPGPGVCRTPGRGLAPAPAGPACPRPCPPCPLHAYAPACLPGLGCSGFRAPDFPRSGHGILCGRRRPLKAQAEAT